MARVLAPVEGGDGAVYRPFPIHDELVDVLEQLDFLVRNLSELRKEVQELRNSLQNLAAEIVCEVRYGPCLLLTSSVRAQIYSIAWQNSCEYVNSKS